MVAANLMRSERRSLLLRGLTLGVLMGACFASVRQTQAQHSAVDYYNQGVAWAENEASTTEPLPTSTRRFGSIPSTSYAYSNRGYAWNAKKEYDRALADYDEAIRLDPKYAKAYSNRGHAWCGKKEYDRAITDFNQAIRLDPNLADAYHGRGDAWENKGEYNKTIADYNQAIGSIHQLLPCLQRSGVASSYLSHTAHFRDGRKAVDNARQAYQLSGGKNPDYLDTLAAAYAEKGDFRRPRNGKLKPSNS